MTAGSQDWTNAHQGAMFFGKGCAKGIRNVTAHGSRPDERLAPEALASLSLLARWIDEADVERVSQGTDFAAWSDEHSEDRK